MVELGEPAGRDVTVAWDFALTEPKAHAIVRERRQLTRGHFCVLHGAARDEAQFGELQDGPDQDQQSDCHTYQEQLIARGRIFSDLNDP